jgi:hypothetical protein
MPRAAHARFVDQLPAVFRQDERGGENFLGRFLRAFEVVFAEVEAEIDAIPGLFAVTADAALDLPAAAGDALLRLDTASGLCPGDVVLLEPPRGAEGTPELATVAASAPGPASDSIALAAPLRFAHARGTALRPLGEPGRSAAVAVHAPAGAAELVVPDAAALGIAPGEALRVEGEAGAEHVRVVAVEGGRVAVEPRLAREHAPGCRVTAFRFAPRRTPPQEFAHAPRTGAELLLDAEVRAGGRFVELDTLSGIEPGDVLRLRDFDPARVEFARVAALPEAQAGPALLRRGVVLQAGVRHAHAVGTGVDVPRLPAGASVLAAPVVGTGVERVAVRDPDALGARPGDVVVLGALDWEGGRPVGGHWAEVRGTAGGVLALTPPLEAELPAGTPVARLLPEGGALEALEWLAGWIGLALRPGRGERWNRDLVRRAGAVWPVRGTRAGVQAFLDAYLRGQATAGVFDPSNPLQVGLVSTVGVDTIVCGGQPHSFWVDVHAERRSMRLRTPEGMEDLVHAAQEALHREKPAHAVYTLRVHAPTLQIGSDPERHIGARVGETTLLWSGPLAVPGDR